MLNLASNAVKFTASGTVSISADIINDSESGLTCRVEVADTGIGLSEEAMSKLFEKFVQADASTTRRFGGTGLGLAICKQIVELMGGRIGVNSVEGDGSTFWFEMDLERCENNETQTGDAAPPPDSQGPRHALVAYVNDIGRAALIRQMEAFDYSVTAVADADAAKAAIADATENGQPFEAALIDQDIDGTSGVVVARALVPDDSSREMRSILLTNRGLSGDAARQMNSAVDAYLSKPVRPSRLAAALTTGSEEATGDGPTAVTFDHDSGDAKRAGHRILLAEDNDVNQRVALAMLLKGGHEIDIANDGVEALMMASKKQYDVVLMDIQMPTMSGIDATQKIRRLPGPISEVPIIAMTANAMVGDREAYLSAGMNDYVSKPIDPGMLSAALTRQIGRETTASEIPKTATVETQQSDISLSALDDVLSEMDSLLDPQ